MLLVNLLHNKLNVLQFNNRLLQFIRQPIVHIIHLMKMVDQVHFELFRLYIIYIKTNGQKTYSYITKYNTA